MANRPLSPHLQIWKWGPHMLTSILHRVSGNGMAFVGLPWPMKTTGIRADRGDSAACARAKSPAVIIPPPMAVMKVLRVMPEGTPARTPRNRRP